MEDFCAQLDTEVTRDSQKNVLRSFRTSSMDAFLSREKGYSMRWTTAEFVCLPSMNSPIFWMRPWTTASVCTAVARASACVSRSSLFRTASISISLKNLFANLTALAEQSKTQVRTDSLEHCRLRLSVTRASMEISSIRILTTISSTAVVEGIHVYISRRLTKCSIDSSNSTSASQFEMTPLAAWATRMSPGCPQTTRE